jgi:hypothetical protein
MAASDEDIKPTKRNKRNVNTNMKLLKLAILLCSISNFFYYFECCECRYIVLHIYMFEYLYEYC